MTLRLHAVDASYATQQVLRGVDLVVPRERVVALLGPNGAGKSTTLRVCSGLLTVARGRVELDGCDVTDLGPAARAARGVCHVAEGRAIFPALTVAENLRLMHPPGAPDRTDEVIDAFPVLGNRLGQVAGTMSGGEQQMLALARTVLADAEYVLLDEVSMGLAPLVVEQILAYLRILADRGVALLVVEQYVAAALSLADIVYVMANGRIAFCGEPGELDANALSASYLGTGARAPGHESPDPGSPR